MFAPKKNLHYPGNVTNDQAPEQKAEEDAILLLRQDDLQSAAVNKNKKI